MDRSDHVINGLVQQRNAAMDNSVNAYADFMVARERIEALEAEVADLKAKLAAKE